MLYLKIIISFFGIAASLYVFLNNIIRKFQFAVNRLFAAISFITVIMTSSLLYMQLVPDSRWLYEAALVYFATISMINHLYFHYAQIFPRWEKRSPRWFIILSALPGTAVFFMTLCTNMILENAACSNGEPVFVYGRYFPIYIAVFAFNILGTFFTLVYKTRMLANESFRIQLFYRSIGDHISATLITVSFIILPYFFGLQQYHAIGIPLSAVILLIINNYAISDERFLDFRKFYARGAYWCSLFLLLAVPAYCVLRYIDLLPLGAKSLYTVTGSLLAFMYFFLVYRFVSPRIADFFRKGYLTFEKNITDFFQGISGISAMKDRTDFWEMFFNSTIDALEPRFGIESAALYMRDESEGGFVYNYGFGKAGESRTIDESNLLVQCLKAYPVLIERSMLFTDDNLREFSTAILAFFDEHTIDVVLPFYDHEKNLIGILTLGAMKNGKPYPMDLISAFEIYRIHFEATIVNSMYLEHIKASQIAEHDRMVIRNIKSRLTPKKLSQINGIRISSFYLNNSEQGGDYFDTLPLGQDKIGIFIADTADAGVDSAILGLECYSLVHAQPASYDSPEKLLNIMNWVVSTSRFSKNYAPAFYLIYSSTSRTLKYSNAAMKPMVLFDAGKNVFIELDSGGIPVGIDRGFNYEVKTIQVYPGSIGLLYSDGLENAANSSGVNYSIGRIKDIMRLNASDTPALLVRKIFADFKNFIQNTQLHNDVSLIIFKTE